MVTYVKCGARELFLHLDKTIDTFKSQLLLFGLVVASGCIALANNSEQQSSAVTCSKHCTRQTNKSYDGEVNKGVSQI